MVGEIRDAETAQYAIQAALTGHLVFSTLHTNDAAVLDLAPGGPRGRALPDQLDAGRAPWRSACCGRICPHCASRALPDSRGGRRPCASPCRQGKRVKVKEGEGCFECRGTGYFGRTRHLRDPARSTTPIKHLIIKGADAPEIKREAVKNGMRTLRQSALRKLAEGVTTFEEVVRVTGL